MGRCIGVQHRSNASIRPSPAQFRCAETTATNARKQSGATPPMEKGIFEGLRVSVCGSFPPAPGAATVLSDFGADVIKIEPPGSGDPYRSLPDLPGYPVSEHNFAWLLEARNKRSIPR